MKLKIISKISQLILLTVVLFSCKRDQLHNEFLKASLRIVNAVPSDDSSIKVNFDPKQTQFSDSREVDFYYYDGRFNNGSRIYGLLTERQNEITIVKSSDTLKTVLSLSVNPNPGEIFTLFLTGRKNLIDTILIRESFPQYTDSLLGVRFINLSPDLESINVNLKGETYGSMVSHLKYKQVTNFKNLSAKSNKISYVFEFRDPNTNELLKSFNYNNIGRMRNVTLVFRGVKNNGPEIEVARINHY